MADAPQIIQNLVETFEENIHEYKNPKYNETLIRVEFVNPFWKALGWDVTNEAGYSMAFRDVIHEDEIKIGGATKAPDYSFRIGGVRQFFLETKKPAINLKDNPAPAFQLRRYSYSAKLPISVLTDFEEFIIYDCRIKPALSDKPSVGRVRYFTFRDYIEKWDEISSILSKESVLKGRLDKFCKGTKSKRGTAEIDKDFLADLDKWRMAFARNFALRNKELSARELNYTVQLTIDRLIFLRMCEDRGIENYGQLLALLNGVNIYSRLVQIYKKADDRYNSGLFHFKPEKGMSSQPDLLTPNLALDDKVLKEIIKHLYYPDCPYEFSMLPVEVLGNAYEQFLGKVIHLTKGHQAKIEEKPEVRKAGGVYYTPKYIVDYIVENTVGKLCEGKTPHEVRELRILDPACGSGSFLLGAFQYLLDWHIKYYQEEMKQTGKIPTVIPDKGKRKRKTDPHTIYQGRGGQWFLTTTEKKRILTNNIYGVDIDANAVEVTKLSLLLKVLENESQDSLIQQLSLWHERALPDLSSNIKCGNSLIGSDFYEGKQLSLIDEEAIYQINAFDWNTEFQDIMKKGGFHAVVGNPPYIRIQAMKEWIPESVEHYKTKYKTAQKGNYDIYMLFVEKGLNLLSKKGFLGYILPHKFFNSKYGGDLRDILSKNRYTTQIIHFGHQQIFQGATTYTCLLFLNKKSVEKCRFVQVNDLTKWRNDRQAEERSIPSENFTKTEWNFIVGKGVSLYEKLKEMPIKLGDIAHLFVGLQTDADAVYILEELEQKGQNVLCQSKATGKQYWLENSHLKFLLKGSLNIHRYTFANVSKRLIFPYEIETNKSVLIAPEIYRQKYPLTWAYLAENKEILVKRNKGRLKKDEWYGYIYKKNHTRFGSSKLVVPSIASGSCFCADLEGTYYFVGSGGGGGGGYGILLENMKIRQLYLLGLLNSSVLNFFLKTISTPFRGGYIALNRQYIEKLPIYTIDFSKSGEKAQHDKIVELVEQMLDLYKKLSEAKEPQLHNMLQRQIETTDNQIDRLVYRLYDLTEDEIKIVEEAVK